jgi:hypothetical protein
MEKTDVSSADEEEYEEGSDDDWDNIRSKIKGSSSAHARTVQPIAIVTTATPPTPTPINSLLVPSVSPLPIPPFITKQSQPSSIEVNITNPIEVNIINPTEVNITNPIEVNIINPTEVNITNSKEVNITNPKDKNIINETNGDVYLNNPETYYNTNVQQNNSKNVQQNDSTYVLQQSGSLLSGRSTIREPKKRALRVLGPSNKG